MPRDAARHPRVYELSPRPPALRRRHSSVESDNGSQDRKRRRTSCDAISASRSTGTQSDNEENIESIDLTEVEGASSLSKVLAKQREDAVKAQQDAEQEKGRTALTAYKCPVCMDTPEDATTTVCGHLLCHKCIIDTLKFSQEQRADMTGKGPRGTCPVCRKPLTRIDAPGPKRNLIPLQFQLRKRSRKSASADA